MRRMLSVRESRSWRCTGRDPEPGEACIYVLRQHSGPVRYIGVTTQPLSWRLDDHLGSLGTGYESGQWIARHYMAVRMEALIYVPADQRFALETVAIKAARDAGLPLTNINGGK